MWGCIIKTRECGGSTSDSSGVRTLPKTHTTRYPCEEMKTVPAPLLLPLPLPSTSIQSDRYCSNQMPGTIQVSVLEFVDPTSSPSPSSSSFDARTGDPISLKVVIGKREYQRWGKGDLSFPVISLRENLVMTLHDAEGREIFRTDVETMLVAEKGLWDTFFQLEGGGCVQLKLQFLLTEEERKRVHDMRESVLKKKHEQLLKSGPRHSVPEEIIGGKTLRAATELHREGLHNWLDNSINASGSSLVTPLSQEIQEYYGCSSEQDVPRLPTVNKQKIEAQLSQSDIHEIQDFREDSQLGCGSIISGNVAAISYFASTKLEEHRAPSSKKKILPDKILDSSVKKMISALESSLFQGIRPLHGPTLKLKLRKIETEGSLRGLWLEETNAENSKVGQTIAKSFSAGMLSGMSSEQSAENKNLLQVKKLGERKRIDLAINMDTMTKKTKHVGLKNNWSSSNLYEGPNHIVELVKTKETASLYGTAESVGGRHEPSFHNKNKSVLEIIKRRNTTAKGNMNPGHGPGFDVGHAVETKIKEDVLEDSWLSRVEEPENIELPCGSSTCQQQRVLNVDGGDSRGRSYVNDAYELTSCKTSNANMDLDTYFDLEQWILGSYGSWKIRHLCITTGSKQLKDLIKGFGVHVETCLMGEKFTRRESDEELIIHGETCTEEIESEKISSFTESFVDISKINGGLLEQVARAVILIVACGTFFLSTGQIKSR